MDPYLRPFPITLHYRITMTFCLLDFFSCSEEEGIRFVFFAATGQMWGTFILPLYDVFIAR